MRTEIVNSDAPAGRPRTLTVAPARDDRRALRRFDSADLFAGTTEIEIVHEDAVYRLKITRQGKLILNR